MASLWGGPEQEPRESVWGGPEQEPRESVWGGPEREPRESVWGGPEQERRESGCRAAPGVGTDTVTGSELQVGLFLCSRHQAEPLHSLVLGSIW